MAISACTMWVSDSPGTDRPLTRKPNRAAPSIPARKAPTIPPQKRSGTNTVKCQTAIPIITQTRRLIGSPSPLLLALLSPALLALLGALRGSRARGARDRWLWLGAVAVSALGGIATATAARRIGRGWRGGPRARAAARTSRHPRCSAARLLDGLWLSHLRNLGRF